MISPMEINPHTWSLAFIIYSMGIAALGPFVVSLLLGRANFTSIVLVLVTWPMMIVAIPLYTFTNLLKRFIARG